MAILGPSLYRRRSQPLPTLLDEKLQLPPQQQSQPAPSTPATPSSSKTKPEGGSPRQPLVASGIIIRKVSKIFSGRSSSKRSSKRIPKDQDSPNLRHAPVGHIAVTRPGALRYGPTTPSPSTESFDSDIRQPAGLGRLRTGSLSSNCEPELDSRVPHERVRALSTPTLLRMGEPGVGATSGIVRRVGGQRSLSRVPQAILNLIVSFLPRRYVTYVATVSWAFCEAARHTLYAHLDGRYIRPARFVKLISLLAVRHDLGLLTEALTIHVWPPSFYVEGEAQISMLAPSIPSFAKALLNMHRLKSITLPTFEYTILRYFSPLMLTKATFLNHTMSIGDHLQLRAWLECQEEIRHLAFPVLVERPNDGPSSPLSQSIKPPSEMPSTPTTPALSFLASAPSTPTIPASPRPQTSPHPIVSPQPSPLSTPLPSPRIPFPQTLSSASSINSDRSSAIFPKSKATLAPILPRLESLSATPNLTTSLLAQPHSSQASFPPLNGLSLRIHKSLYSGLRPSTVMQVIACRGTKAIELCFGEDIDPRTMEKVLTSVGALLGRSDSKQQLIELSVVVEPSTPDEGIYRILQSTISRFKGLQILKIQRASGLGRSHPASTSTRKLTSNRVTYRPQSSGSEMHVQTGLSDIEQTYLSNWLKCCPSLGEVWLSSGVWWSSV